MASRKRKCQQRRDGSVWKLIMNELKDVVGRENEEYIEHAVTIFIWRTITEGTSYR
jgi:hypothetical protein